MKTSWLAFGCFGLGFAGLIAACAGADAPDVLGAAPDQATASSSGAGTSGGTSGNATSSGNTTSSSGNTSSGGTSGTSGTPCLNCAAPPAGCISTSTCEKCSYTCPDSGGAVKCNWSKNFESCPSGYYCDSATCGEGVCVKKTEEQKLQLDPVCGCNGVTYWNATIAGNVGMSVRTTGQCKDDAATCGGFAPAACPNGASCNLQVKNKQACNVADQQGVCWGLPDKCPLVVIGGRARPCGAGLQTCGDACTAIRKGGTWYDDGSCPQ